MSRRSKMWVAVAVLLGGVVLWSLWPRGERPSAAVESTRAGVAASAGAPGAAGSVVPFTLLSSTNNLAQAKARAAQYRLSNTTEPYDQLLRRDSALVLENARWDAAKPLDLNIPPHLRAAGDPGSYIVKANGPANAAFQARLQAAGLVLVSYIPHNAWLVRGSHAQVTALNGVAAVVPFEPYFKLKSSLLPLAVEQQPLPPGTVLNLLLFADAAATTAQALSEMGVTTVGRGQSPFGPVLTVQAPANSLTALAGLPGVQVIERSGARVPANDLARVAVGVSTDTIGPDNYFGLTGTNVLVAVTDSGIDITHPDLVDRVFTNTPNAGTDVEGHGTHVAAIIAGSGAVSATVPTNPPGSEVGASFRGKAPAANLFSVVLNEAVDPGLDFDSYAQQQVALTNALIANNSWVQSGVNEYNVTAASYDAAVRDALPGLPGSQPVLFVFAAGNDGGGNNDGLSGIADSIYAPGTAKNVITVGALEQLRGITNEVVINGQTNAVWDKATDSDNEVASYSARGNVGIGIEGDYGRFKPDLVAPGTFVISAQSSNWDQVAYYSITNRQVNTFENQVLEPDALNQYSIFVPPNAVGLQIVATPQDLSSNAVTNLTLYVRVADSPTVTNYDAVATNQISIPPALPLTPGASYFYAVGNPTNQTLSYDLTTIISVTNNLEDYNRVLKQLNDALGPNYRYESGTSMAAPTVSGLLALMQEFYEQRFGATNSPALMKAMLINGARSASSIYGFQVRNTINFQGWGLASLPTSLPPTTNAVTPGAPASFLFFDQSPTNALATGQSQTRLLTLDNTAQGRPLRVTLVWTDPPGNPAAGIKLVNDLDLVVTNLDTGAVYFGNDIPANSDFTSKWPTNSAPNLDAVNNVENVYISVPGATNFSVTVIGHRVNVNAVTAHTNDTVQDYALVISSGNGEVTNAFTVAEQPVVTGPADNVTVVTNTTVVPLLNQTAGANAPLISSLNGMTNQWHFYVVTNYGTNVNFTNAAFITFLPPTLSVPRGGTRATIDSELSRIEADIDMYVSQDPALTNLDAAAIAAATQSRGRGGTEVITFSNSVPGQVYYVGIKSEDQMAGQYGFLGIFSDQPFSEKDEEGNLYVRGLPVPALIPDGSPTRPGGVLLFGIATEPIKVRRVVVTNIISHDNFGDLLVNLSHNNAFAVLHNHTFGDGGFTQVLAYDDSEQNDIPGSRKSDGPGSLRDFVTQEGIGLWLWTVVDDSPFSVGQVDSAMLKIEPQLAEDEGDTFILQPGGWGYTFVEVPPEATNLTINVSGNSLPVELYVREGDFPDLQVYDYKQVINPPGGSLSISKYSLPPLHAGTYFIGVYNPNAVVQTVTVRAQLELDLSGVVPVVFTSTDPVPLLDDAITFGEIDVTSTQRISSVEVGLRVNHPRVSDLAFTLISPSGKRILLMENRGGTDTNGLGADLVATNATTLFYTNNFEGVVGAEWSPATIDVTPIGSRRFLGQFASQTVTLSLTNLPAHTNVVVAFDLFQMRSWDGNYPTLPVGPDIWGLRVAGDTNPLIRTTFTVPEATSPQSYPSNYPFGSFAAYTGAVETNTLGYNHPFGSPPENAVYRMRFEFPHTNSSLQLEFFGENLQGVSDESWGLDDVSVALGEVASAYQYLTFTEDTNKTTTPIKFGVPPFASRLVNNLVWQDGFENGAPGNKPAGSGYFSGGWYLDSGEVDVLANGNFGLTSDSGSQCLDINGWIPGSISTNVMLVPGRQYLLSFANARNPDSVAFGTVPSAVVELNSVTLVSVSPSQINSWTNLMWQSNAVSFFATSVTNVLRLRSLTAGPRGVIFDTLAISEIDEEGGVYFPEESLTPLKGDVASGTWRLEVWDSRVGATNPAPELLSWNLSFIFQETEALPVVVEPGVTVTNTVPPGGMQILAVDVPLWAAAATNSLLSADLPLLVWFNQTLSPVGAAPPDTQFYGGAVTNGVETLVTNGVPPLVPGQRYYLGIQNTNTTAVTYSFRVDFDITLLFDGVPVTNSLAGGGIPRYYAFDVSTNASAVSFDLYGMDGDLNLVARRGQLPDLGTYDQGSFNLGTNDEQILVFTNGNPVALTPGRWYLGVFNATVLPVNYTIRATELTNPFPSIVTLTNGIPYVVSSNSSALGSLEYYRYVVTGTAARAQFEIFGASGDFTLVARKGLPLPDLSTFDYLSANPGTNDELIVVFTNSAPVTLTSGDWFLTAVKVASGTAAYTIMATEWNQTGQPITITNIDTSFGDFCITWNSLPGAHYIVQSTPTLAPPAWTNASPTITAFDYTTTWCTPITGTMNFFRVVEGIALDAGSVSSITIASIQAAPGGITLTWYGPVNASFQVQWTDSLTPAVWNTVATPVTSTNGVFTFTDDGSQTAPLGPFRFYRLFAP